MTVREGCMLVLGAGFAVMTMLTFALHDWSYLLFGLCGFCGGKGLGAWVNAREARERE